MAMIREAQSDPGAQPNAAPVLADHAVLADHENGPTTRDLVRMLERGGWERTQAGNLVGLLHGFRPVRAGWTVHEIEHLRFLRARVKSGLEH
ncbi:MAG: hypothetical protein ABIV26_06600 [Candidatus Limnocylindrales bacterium]